MTIDEMWAEQREQDAQAAMAEAERKEDVRRAVDEWLAGKFTLNADELAVEKLAEMEAVRTGADC